MLGSVSKLSLLDVLKDVWWIGAVALGVSLIATPIVRLIAYRARIVDRPDDLLKPHTRPTAYLGGLAMCAGLLVGLGCYLTVMPRGAENLVAMKTQLFSGQVRPLLQNPVWNALAIALGSLLITIVGLLDDLYRLRARQKVLGQVAAAAVLICGGVGYRMAVVFFSSLRYYPPPWVLVPISAAMCIVLVIAACNATNLLDGLDGLCGGVTGIIALGFLALAVWLATWAHPGHENTDYLRVGLCLAMAGAVLGFLPYNIPPASIFMGDAGSMLLGFFVATSMVLFCQEGNARWFVAAWAVFALPGVDTGLAVVRRVLSGKSIFAGDRSHLYDQLVDRGMSIKRVVVLFYILSAATAVVGVVLAIKLRGRHAVAIYAALGVALSILFVKLGMVKPEPRQPAGDDSSSGGGDE